MPAVAAPPKSELLPARDESQVQFIERGNKALYGKIRDAVKRSKHLLRLWRRAGRDGELDRIAAERFPEAEFHTVHDSPVFSEHKTRDQNGNEIVYDRAKLASIVAACNERILDTGDFSIISAGHTPDEQQLATGMPMPDTLGYSGPFRLGMIGNTKPRWAIFADEHVHHDELDRYHKLPRRSPEVWMEDGILDPIAALGAETPRLDTGIVRNCRLPSGRMVMKYSAACTTSPGGVNTHVPAMAGKKKDNYAAGDQPMPDDNPENALDDLSDRDIERIVNGVMSQFSQSKQMQFLASLMPTDWTPGAPEQGEITPAPGADGTVPAGDQTDPAVQLPEDEPDDDTGGDQIYPEAGDAPAEGDIPPDRGGPVDDGTPAPAPEDEDNASPDEEAAMDDDEKERYAAHDSAGRKGFLWMWRKHRRSSSKYSAGNGASMTTATPPAARSGDTAAYARQKDEENQQLRDRIDQLEARNRHQERFSRLTQLRQSYAFELKDEAEETKDLSQEQFDRHLERIKRNYARIPADQQTLYVPPAEVIQEAGADPEKPQREKYSRRAMEIFQAKQKAGQYINSEEAYQLAAAEDK